MRKAYGRGLVHTFARGIAASATALLVGCSTAGPSSAPTSAPAGPAPSAAPSAASGTSSGPGAASSAVAPGSGLAQLITAADAEGHVNLSGPSNLGDAGAQSIFDAMNATYGTHIQGTFSSNGNLQEIVSKTLQEQATGGPPSSDSVMLNDSYVTQLVEQDALEQVQYQQLFQIPAGAIGFDSHAVGYANQLVLPAYNTTLVAPADVPQSWDDMTDPRWAGKIGVHNATHHFVRLSLIWGDARTTDFVQKIAALKPRLGLINETYQALILGETLVSFTQTNSQMDAGVKKGDPVAFAMNVRPIIAPEYYCSATKGAQHPNAAALFCGFMSTKTAQDAWSAVIGAENILDPATPVGQIYAQNKNDVITWDESLTAAEYTARDTKYSQLLGFR